MPFSLTGSPASSHQSSPPQQSLDCKGLRRYSWEVLEPQQTAEPGLSFKGVLVEERQEGKEISTTIFPLETQAHHSGYIFLNFRIMERLRLKRNSGGPAPLLEQGPAEPAAQNYVQMAFQYLLGWRLHDPSGQPVPVLSQFTALIPHDKRET